ncbi:ABC transporter substrate-binding protein [Bacteroidota bacterium]|jgi:phospholipid transport system substrate-binding protein|nr:ABC transporter substrate-binding protein [Bacteroidota bacterium]MEC7859427.1 ABC transporter substrate-binding protein [Pseudomonadota bacterium]|tara:strand:+ start:27481 stop:28107 length:627 start_codon:yes stop_codon:yes gene_type:complete
MLRFFCWKITILLLLSLQLHSDKNSEIYSFIDDNAQYFLTVIKEEGSNFEDNPDEFKEKLKNIWEPMVDVQLVSRLILNKAYKSASQEQIYRFQERTKKLLLDTYVSTLLEFKDYEIFTNAKIKTNKNKTFEIEIKFDSSSSYSFITKFTVYRNKGGELKIINIIIDGINLGLTFRNQFQGVLKKEGNNLDKAIESWQPLSSEDLFSN